MTPQEIFKSHGFPYPDNLIMAFIGGSTQHGATNPHSTKECHDPRHETPCTHYFHTPCKACQEECDPKYIFEQSGSDTDWYGIFIPPKQKVIGIDKYETWVFPSNTEHRSRGVRDPFELDISLHSLQKWAAMAAKGNPTVLGYLFSTVAFPIITPIEHCHHCGCRKSAHDDAETRRLHDCPGYKHGLITYDGDVTAYRLWQQVTINTALFISKESLWPFIHYGNDQLQRLMGLRGQKDVNRPILEQLYGYDTKYAMHIVRLMSEAKELMQTGKITYPRPEVELLKDIRRGKYKLNEVVEMANQLQADAIEAQKVAPLPEKVDRDKISELIADVHLEFYRG